MEQVTRSIGRNAFIAANIAYRSESSSSSENYKLSKSAKNSAIISGNYQFYLQRLLRSRSELFSSIRLIVIVVNNGILSNCHKQTLDP